MMIMMNAMTTVIFITMMMNAYDDCDKCSDDYNECTDDYDECTDSGDFDDDDDDDIYNGGVYPVSCMSQK